MINWKGDNESLTIPEMVCRLNKAEQSIYSRPALTEGERIVNYIKQVRGLEKANRRLRAQLEPLENRTDRELLSAHDDLNEVRLAFIQLGQKNKNLIFHNKHLQTIATNESFAVLKKQLEDELTFAHDDLSALRRENLELRGIIHEEQKSTASFDIYHAEMQDAIYKNSILEIKNYSDKHQTIWQRIKLFWKLK